MGDNTKLYINPKLSNREIVELIHHTIRKIKNKPDMALPLIQIGETEFGGYFHMLYTRNTKADVGMLMVSESTVGGIPVKMILGEAKNPEKKLLKTIAKSIGGIFSESESHSNLIEYDMPDELSNVVFLAKSLISGGPHYENTTPENYNKQIDQLIQSLNELKNK